ncbi:DUF4469 domain-containing protein [Aliifodinibius sp. S!AR15-10]|uniref:DNA-binding domain-containing protein n=1 Tax=Aliifodinibius sp. S!AR15-10 TaxID=2950437 RepID=UPI00285E74ED|nr:DNA-binding domain-containing protein [Aliifodinibius sp. S!AR15-10]MDR8393622.1 DUF4469 domain-containing protein [Aliifodinibius sp. S!AR15-10]
MSLQFYLTENKITENPDDYMAVSINPESYDIDEVYEHMTREGSTITKAEALAGFEEVMQGIINLVKRGYAVNTPLVNISPGIRGVFESEEDNFDTKRHEIKVNVNPGVRLQEVVEEIDVEKVASRKRRPTLAHYYDSSSDKKDETITPAGGARITGSLLKFDHEDPNQGIFFINMEDDTETRVKSQILRNMPAELIFLNPTLASGTYRLEVRSVVKNTTEIRTGILSEELTVS